MTHVSVRAPCGARVAGLMFPFDCPRWLAGVDGIRAEPYNEVVLTSLVSVRVLPLTPPFRSRGRGRFAVLGFLLSVAQ